MSSLSDPDGADAMAAAAAFFDSAYPLLDSDAIGAAVASVTGTHAMDIDDDPGDVGLDSGDEGDSDEIPIPPNPIGPYTAEYFSFVPDNWIE